MVKLEESTYEKIRHLLQRDGGRVNIEPAPESCDVCLRIASRLIVREVLYWFLCPHHAREIGVLW